MFQKCKGLSFYSTVLCIVKLFIEAEFWIRRLILLCVCVCEIIAFVIKFLPSVIYAFAFYPKHKKMYALEKKQ